MLWLQGEDQGPAKVEDELTRGVASAYALTQIEKSRTLEESVRDYHDKDDEAAHDAIRHVYSSLLADGDADRAGEASARATRLLDNYRVKGGLGDLFH